MKAIIFLFSLLVFSAEPLLSQAPNWVAPYPTTSELNALSVQLNFQLSGAGRIYWVIFAYDTPPVSPVNIRNWHDDPITPTFRGGGTLTYNAGDIGSVISAIHNTLVPNRLHTIHIVSESFGGVLGTTQKLTIITPKCAPIDMDFGYNTPQLCVNKGITQTLRFTIFDSDPDVSGIFPGTKFFIDWGDGQTTSWTTTLADNMIPNIPKIFSHNYTGTTNCNYEFMAVIQSACDPMIVKQFKGYTVVHGRDIPADGDGQLMIVDAATGSATILVCEGNEHLITLQDMSTWNCQAPTFIDGSPAPPNDEPRTIQWVYGMDDGGALMNTIGQTLNVFNPVVIGGSTNTVRTINGYEQLPVITPATYQGELSQTIQIPATCRVGEYYDVYLRNWNKCNVFGIDPPVFTSIRILVVASPAPPVAPDRTICFGEPTTLTAAHGVPAGTTLTWYANADKTGQLSTGAVFTPSITIPGTYTYYVADEGIVAGNNCEGPVEEVVLTVEPEITGNTIGSAQTICYNSIPAGLTGSVPGGGIGTFSYQWQSSPNNSVWTNIGGATSQNYAPGALTSSTYYRRVISSGTCVSQSPSVLITIYGQLTSGSIGTAQSICYNTTPAGLTQTSAPTGGTGSYTFQWQSSPDNSTWSNIASATSSTYSPPALTESVYYRRRVTSGSCGTVNSNAILITVYPNLTPGSIGSPQTICYNTSPAGLTQTAAPAGGNGTYSYQWQSSPDNSTWTDISGATAAGYSPGNLTVNRYFRRRVSSFSCTQVFSNVVLITVYGQLTPGTIGTAQSICYNTIPVALTQLTAPGGGTGVYTYQWQSSPDNSTWTNIGGATSAGYSPSALISTTYFRRRVTSGSCGTVTSNTITVTVGSSPSDATFTGNGPLCFNGTGTLSSVLTGGAPPYTLTITGFPGSPVLNYTSGSTIDLGILTPGTHTYTLTAVVDACGTTLLSGLPKTVDIVVYNDLTAGTVGSPQSLCYNTVPSPLTQTAAPTGGTGTYTYQWQSSPDNSTWTNIGGATSAGYSPAALTASTYYRRRVTSGSCGTVNSLSVLITVYGNFTPGSIASAQTICYNTVPATLTQTAAPSGGTGTYTYQWQSSPDNSTWSNIGGATSPGYSPAALTTSTYFRRQVTSGSCGNLNSPSILITVYGNLVGGTIGNDQTICYNTIPVALSQLTAPAGGSGAYSFQWQSSPDNTTWSNIGGATSSGYAPAALTANTYYRRQVTSGTCGTVNTPSILVTVYGNLTAGTVGSPQSICYNTTPSPLTQTAAPTGGTGTYTFQWQSSPDNTTWTNIGGATSAGYSPAALTASTYYRRRVTSGSCGTVNSLSVLITIYGNFTPGSIGSAQTICYNTVPAALTQTTAPSGGTGTYTYQWQSSPDNSTWSNIGGATSPGYSPAALTTSTYFRRQVTSGSCGTVNSTSILITVYGNLVAGTIGNDQTICYNTIPVALSQLTAPAGGTGAYSFQWQSSPDNTTWTNIGGATSAGYAPAALTANTYYRRQVTSGSCGTVNTPSILIAVYPVLISGTVGSDQTICFGEDVTAFTSTAPASGGSGSFFYTWQYTTNMSAVPGDGSWSDIPSSNNPAFDYGTLNITTRFIRKAEEATCIAPVYSNPITVTVLPLLAGGTIGTNQAVCYGTDIPAFTNIIAPGGGDNNFTYTWQYTTNMTAVPGDANWTDIPGSDVIAYDHGILTNETKFIRKTVDGSCNTPAYSNMVTVAINPLPVTSSITGDHELCDDDVNKVFQVTNTPGSTYEWTVPPGLLTKSFDSGLYFIIADAIPGTSGSGTIQVIETNAATGCRGVPVFFNITVSPVYPGEDITGPASLCQGDMDVAFSVTDRPGSSYSWVVPAGASISNDPGNHEILVSFSMALTGTISVVETSAGGCVTLHNPKTVVINPLPAVYNLTAPVAYCAGEPGITITLNNSQTGVNYQLYRNGVPDAAPMAGNNGSALNWTNRETGTYHVVATNATTGCSQMMNGTVVPSINVVDGGTIGNDQVICENQPPQAFVNVLAGTGGGSVTYQWQYSTDNVSFTNIAGATSALYSHGGIAQDTWFRRVAFSTMGSSICSDLSNTILVNVNNLLPGIISADQSICEATAPDALTGTSPVIEPGATITFRWLTSTDGSNYQPIPGATSDTYTPGDLTEDTWFRREVTAILSGTACTRESNAVKISIIDFNPGSIATDQTICTGTIPAAFTSIPPSGTGIFTFQWESSADNISWTHVGGATSETFTSPALSADTWFRRGVISTFAGKQCTRYTNVVLVTVINFDPGTIGSDQTICENTAPAALTSLAPSGDGSFTYRWFHSTDGASFVQIIGASGETYSPGVLTQDTWYRREVTATSGTRSCVAETNVVRITVNNINAGAITGEQTICESTAPTVLGSIPATSDGTVTYKWYQSSDGLAFTEIAGATSETYSPPALTSDTWFRRDAFSTLGPANCVEASNIIRVTVINFDPGSIGNAQTICEGTTPAMLMGVAATGEGVRTYQWESSLNGTDWNPVPGAISVSYTPGILDEDTWYRRVAISTLNATQCTKYSNTVLITINNLVQGMIEEDQTICEGEVPAPFTSIAATGDGTITYQWQYSTDGVSFATISGATGETYAAVAPMADTWFRRQVISTLNGNQCTKLTTPVIVVVNNFNPGSVGSSQTICEGDTPAALTSAPPAGDGTFTYQWQQSADGITFADIPLATDETFNPPSLTADTWYKRIVRSTDGSKVCVKETNTIRITVINFLPGSIDADQIICENTSPASLTGVAPSGDGAFTFRWFRSNDGTTFTPIAGASGDTYIPGQLTADTWYRREVTAILNGKVCTEETNAVRITVNNLLPGSISGDQTICEGTVPAAFPSLPATGDGDITYIWSRSSDGFNFTTIGETSETYSPPALTEDTWFRRDAVSTLGSSVCIKETNLVKVTVLNFQPGTIGNDQTLCSGSVPAIINGVAAGGDGTKTYQWESSPDGLAWTSIPGATAVSYVSPALSSNTYFRRVAIATLNGTQCTGYSNSVIITVNNFDPGSISADQTICEGSALAPFSGVPAAGDGTITYQWQSGTDGLNFMNIPGATSETYTAGVLFTDTWYRRQAIAVLNGVQCIENTMPVMVTVINFNPGTISSEQTICPNDTPAAFTATAPSGDGIFAFQWESSVDNTVWSDIPGATADVYTPGSLLSDRWFRRRVTSTLNSVVCSSVTNTVRVTVINFLPGSISADQTICEGIMPVPLASIPATGDGSFTYRWFASSDGTTFTEIAGAIYETYSPAAPGGDTWYKREVTSTLNGSSCVDETNTVRVTVLNFSPGSISGDVTICEGDTPAAFGSIAPSGDAPSYTYQWRQSNDGFNFLDIPGANSETYGTGPLVKDTWYKRVVFASMNGTTCPGETNVVKVTVNNLNAGTIISDQTICSGSDPIPFFSIVHGTADGTMTYQWQISNDGLIFTDIPGTDAAVYDSPALTADTWFRRVTRSTLDAVECSAVSNVVKVTVNNVSGGTISDNETICFGATPPPFTSPDDGSGTGIVTYQWQRSNDNILFSVIPGANNTDYTPGAHYTDTWYKRTMISIRNGILCTAESNVIKVTVNPLPIAILSGGAIICPGEPAVLKVELMAGTGPFELDIENHGVVSGYISNADIPVTPAATTSYRLLRVRDANGCEIISPHANLIGNATVVVRDLPVITGQPSASVICEYGPTAFTVTATGSDLTYQWFVNKGSGFEALTEGGVYFGTGSPILNIFGAPRDLNGYIYHAVVTGCGISVTSGDALLTINTPPVIEVQPVESSICLNGNTSFTVVASGTGLTYQWQVNSGSGFTNVTDGGVYSGATAATLNLTGVPAGFNNHIYRVVISGTCPSPAYSNFVTLRVNPPPVVTLDPAGKSVCDASGTVFFTANGSGMIDSLRWQVNNGGTWTDLYDDGVYSGTNTQQLSFINPPVGLNGREYRLALKAYCATVFSNTAILTVNTNPVVSFPVDPINACGGVPHSIVPVITGGSGTWAQHSWSGDIAPLSRYDIATPEFKTLIQGTYGLNYKVIDSNGCFGTGSVDAIVDSPDANFVQDRPNGCTPLTVQFTKDMTGIDHWEWDFGDGSPVNTTDVNPVHNYTNITPATILYNTVTLSVWSAGGCLAAKTSLVTVYPAINATFSADRIVVCHGESITFTGLTGANTYLWDYGDGTSGPGTNITTHLYTNTDSVPVVRSVSLTTTSYYGCVDSKSFDITVLPRPVPQFTAAPVIQTYSPAGNIVRFTNETNPGAWNWSWEFGDGGTDDLKNPSHTYTDVGSFNVMLSVTNGTCTEKIQHQVNVLPLPPIANFDSIPSGCEPHLITINNTSENTNLSGTTYRWDFGDGGTSVAKNPEYTYHDPGIYRVELTVIGPGGTSVRSQVVHVYPTPMASFDVAPRLVFVNDKLVRAFNLSTGADYFVWDWGDGDTSITKEPTHKYMEEGIFDITLSAYKDNGNGNICYDRFVLSPGVTVEPAGQLRFSSVFRPNLTGPIERTDLPVSGEELDQFFFPAIREKVLNYKLQIFNRLGVLIFESHDINIPWNGYYNGKLCAQGVYVWYVEGKYTNGQVFKQTGDITLLH